jgi:hypothetical protein
LSNGITLACLKQDGKVDSVNDRLINVVIAGARASTQDFNMRVGKISSEQVASDEANIADLTSWIVVGLKVESAGGVVGGAMCGERLTIGIADCNLVILSPKNAMKLLASDEVEDVAGSVGAVVRPRRVLSVFHSLRGFVVCCVISDL